MFDGGRVLVVAASESTLGGAEQNLVDLLPAIKELGWRVWLCVPADGSLESAVRRSGVEVVTISTGAPRSRAETKSLLLGLRLAQALVGGLRIAALVRRERIDVIHSNSSVVVAGAIAGIIARRPHVWHVREVLRGRLWSLLRLVIGRTSSRVACISTSVASNMGPRSISRIRLVPDGVRPPRHLRSPRLPTSRPIVLMAARVSPNKGHAVFIEAAQRIKAGGVQALFVIAGGTLPTYQSLSNELVALQRHLGLGEDLRILGNVSNACARALMRRATVFVSPSTWPEGLGLATIEAMMEGCAVVATAHGGSTDIIRNYENGLLVPPGDSDALASAVAELLRKPQLRYSLARQAQVDALEEYSVTTQALRLSAAFAEAMKAR